MNFIQIVKRSSLENH